MTPPIHRTMTGLEWALLATLSVLWGGTFLFQAVALREIPPLTLVLLRVAVAASILLVLMRATGRPLPRGGRVWAEVAGMSALNNAIPFICFAYAQTQIAAGLAAILNATTPVFGVIVAHLVTDDEKMTPGRLAGVLLGVAGVAVMIGPAAFGRGQDSLPAQLACLGAALSYAVSGIQGRRLQAYGLPPLSAATGQLTASSLLLLPLALALDRPWMLPWPSGTVVASVLALAALSTALAYIIFFRILATAGATNLLLVTFLIPVSAILLAVLLLGESVAPRQLAGMALIAAGLAAIDGRPLARLRGAR